MTPDQLAIMRTLNLKVVRLKFLADMKSESLSRNYSDPHALRDGFYDAIAEFAAETRNILETILNADQNQPPP